MTEKSRELLLGLYRHPHSDTSVEYRYSTDATEKAEELDAFQELQQLGYIVIDGSALGFVIVSLTALGRTAAEQL